MAFCMVKMGWRAWLGLPFIISIVIILYMLLFALPNAVTRRRYGQTPDNILQPSKSGDKSDGALHSIIEFAEHSRKGNIPNCHNIKIKAKRPDNILQLSNPEDKSDGALHSIGNTAEHSHRGGTFPYCHTKRSKGIKPYWFCPF